MSGIRDSGLGPFGLLGLRLKALLDFGALGLQGFWIFVWLLGPEGTVGSFGLRVVGFRIKGLSECSLES